jgi:2-polyprenyl-3-methyl-5-hydroxy-6-metoxy-1,4-benzoquinol methylase
MDQGQQELELLVSMAARAKSAGATSMDHMDGQAAAVNYIRAADFVASYWGRARFHGPILDWGCGYGQVSLLLQRRGLKVLSYDVGRAAWIDHVPELSNLKIKYGEDPVKLPYESGSFGAVLSVGVLEHVPDIDGSLEELNRILAPSGLLFLLMFPNRFSWAEKLADWRQRSVHPFKFTATSTLELLKRHGFLTEKLWRRNFLPRNLTGLNPRVKLWYGKLYRQVEFCDRILANLPPTSFLSGVLEAVARKG